MSLAKLANLGAKNFQNMQEPLNNYRDPYPNHSREMIFSIDFYIIFYYNYNGRIYFFIKKIRIIKKNFLKNFIA